MGTLHYATGALLYDVRNLSDIRQDAEMIAETLNNVGVELMGDRPAHEFAGWTLDNTRTNCKAMNL
jgi:hypothetical protein